MAICRNAATRRAASNHVSFSPLQRQCGARWAVHGRQAHDHVLRALERICKDTGFATNHKRVLTSEGQRCADLEIRNIRVSQQTDLLVDVTLRNNFK